MLTVNSRRPRALSAAALVAALALALTACSSGSGSETTTAGTKSVLAGAAKATGAAEGSARGTIDLTSGHSRYTTRWQGTFAHGRGTTSGRLPGTGDPALEARWTDGTMYVRRTTSTDHYGQSPLGQLTAVRPDTPVWTTVPATEIAAQVFSPLSPPDLVLALSTSGKQETSDGPTIGGVATRKVTVTGHIGLLFNWAGPTQAEVLLDGQDRARRITVTFGNEKVRVDVRYAKVAPKVTIPSAAELAVKSPPAPGPIGPFRTARTGNDGGVAWTLQMAPGRTGTECWRWTSTPPLEVVQPNYLTDTRCLAPPVGSAADLSPDDLAGEVSFVLWTDGTKAPTAAVVARMPAGITQATLGFVGGRTAPATITDGLLTWVGSSAESLAYVGLQSGGTTIDCGVGSVGSPADLTNDTLVGDPFHAAWTCATS